MTAPAPAPTPAPALQSPVPRRRRWFKTLLRVTIASILVIAVVGGVAVPWWLSHPGRFSAVVASLLPELNGTVRFERVRLGWTGPMILEGITIVPADGAKPPVTASQIEGSHGLLAMLLSGGDLGLLSIDGLAVDLAFDKNHDTNLEKLRRPGDPEADADEPRPQLAAVMMRLHVDDAVVRITAPWTIEPWVSDPISIRAALAPTPHGHSEWTIEPLTVLADAQMEPPVAWGVLAYIAPILADATRTSGRFSLQLDQTRLPVGDPGGGTLSGVLSMHEVVVGPGPLIKGMIESLPAGFPRPTAIRVADESHVKFRMADRKVRHEGLEFGVPLPNGQRLDVQSSGTVALNDRSLDLQLVLPIPTDLPKDRPLLAAFAGKQLSIGVAGNLDEPRVVFDGSIGQVAGQVAIELLDKVPELIERVRGERPVVPASAAEEATVDETAGDATPPAITGGDVVDIVGSVLDEVARRRAERRAAEEPEETPPRRGRLRDRLLGPQVPPPPPPPQPTPQPQPTPAPAQ